MSEHFDLIVEPWMPCAMHDGASMESRHLEFGLREVLVRAHDIVELSDSSPLVTASLHRLLLAVLHRIFGPESRAAWWTLWRRGAWDMHEISAYFARDDVRDRFDLFGEHRPFYQVSKIAREYAGPVARLTHELSSGNNATLFDHTTEVAPRPMTPAEAARYLVAYQNYAVGGLVSYEKGQDPKVYKSATAAPLARGALALVRGNNLFETLALNLHRYSDDEPFARQGNDLPTWERDDEPTAGERPVSGYLDLLTWQSRRIQLFPERNGQGDVVVRQVAIMKGCQFESGFSRRGKEPMVAFLTPRPSSKPIPGQDPYQPLGFRDDKALWRDSVTILQSVASTPLVAQDPDRAADALETRPRTLNWLDDLSIPDELGRRILNLDMLGMRADKASVLAWRHERLPLPLAYLRQDPNVDVSLFFGLREALHLAEYSGQAVQRGARELARTLLAPESDRSDTRQPQEGDISRLAASLGLERSYWGQLDVHFRQLLLDLPMEPVERDDYIVAYDRATLVVWAGDLRHAANRAFEAGTNGLDTSARTLKAVAKARYTQQVQVRRALEGYLPAAT